MSVIGIDFGNESCYVAAAKAGGIETLANDYSLRATPSFVAFDGKRRIIGVAAKNQQVTNMKNTVSGFKRLLGRKFNDPHVQRELSSIPTKVDPRPDGSIGYKVNYLDQEQYFSPEQLTAMLFTKLKETSTTALQAQVNDCVIACPVYFTNSERKALLDAAQIAGLNVLRLMNETTATALSYGFYKQDLPDENKPRNVVFVDCGNSSLQVSVCAFTKGKLKMIASAWDQIGGRDFDNVLAEHLANEFYDRFKLNAKTNARAYLRLLTEIEKLKKQMSANSTKLPINIECFMDDVDVSSSMQRSQMEELCAHLFQRVEMTFIKLLQDSKLSLEDIHSVEVVGGSTRIPAIKNLIEQVFGKPASTTLNQDESVSRGAALQCAIMSPAVRVREFGVTDIQNYAVKVSWDGECTPGGEIEVFSAFHAAPFSRLLTLNRKEPFAMTVQYAQPIPFPDPIIGKWFIKDVKSNERGEHQEVKVKVRINHHGVVLISSAALVDKKELEDATNSAVNTAEQGVVAANEEKSNAGDQQQQQQTGNGSEPMDIQQEGTEKKKKATKLIDLPMEVKTHGFSSSDLHNLIQQEAKMIANDARETERVDARNALEEYVYDMRNKLQGGALERYVMESDREAICAQLNDLENWLYEDGENCDRETYVNKLKGLHARTDPLKERANDYENAPTAFDELNHAIQLARGAVNEFKKGTPKYDHLTEAEFLNVSEAADKAQKWLDTNYGKFTQTSRMVDSPVKVADIRHEVQTLSTCVNSVINRPKPKPAAKAAPAKDANATGAGEQNGESAEKETQEKAGHNPMDDATMDVE